MAKAANKTVATSASVADFIAAVPDEARAHDCRALVAIMRKATGEEPRMWGSAIVGFGSFHYRYASGRSGEWFIVGFAPRAGGVTIYITPGFASYADLLAKLGKHKTAKVCLYVKRLADLDLDVLGMLIERSVADMRARHPKS